MIEESVTVCPDCECQVKYYDRVITRTKGGKTDYILIRRLRCVSCRRIHREMTEDILPYKHYEAEVIYGVREGLITCNTLGFEDYPCEAAMNKWIADAKITSYIMRNRSL